MTVAQDLRRFGIDARVEPASSDQSERAKESRAGLGCGQSGQSGLAREGPLMVEFGWYGLRSITKVQRSFRALLQSRARGSRGSRGSRPSLGESSAAPEAEMENAAVASILTLTLALTLTLTLALALRRRWRTRRCVSSA